MKRWLAGALLLLALGAYLQSNRIPNIFAEPLAMPYRGEAVTQKPVRIDVAGEYRACVRFHREPGQSMPEAATDPLRVQVIRDGRAIETDEEQRSYAGDRVDTCYTSFAAEADDTILLSVAPASEWKVYNGWRTSLVVKRDIGDYATYFLKFYGWLGIAVTLAIAAALVAFVPVGCRPGRTDSKAR
jgi:hypothetical protein